VNVCPYQPPPVPTTAATVTITLPGRPVPSADLHTAAVDDTHTVVTQTVPPTCAVGEGEPTPKFIPNNNSVVADPEVGPFGGPHSRSPENEGCTHVSAGASYEKAEAKVPSSRSMAAVTARALSVPPAEARRPAPAGSMHVIDVADIQLLVMQRLDPTDVVGDTSSEPKLTPDMVIEERPVAGALAAYGDVSTGAS
jgi:hypothetical protein